MAENITAGAAVVTAIVSIVATYMVITQWRSDALDRLHARLIEPDLQEALRIIFAAKPVEIVDRENLRLRDAAEKVLNLYDLIGKRVEAETIPENPFLETDWPTILRVAQQLGDFIDNEESLRGTPYKTGFRWLVTKIRQSDAIVRQIPKTNPKHHWTRLPTLPVTGLRGYRNSRPAVAVFIVWNRHVLFLKRVRPPLGWETPGGFLDDGEHPVDCVKREVAEETGFTIENIQLFDVQTGNYGPFNTLDVCYRATVDGDSIPKLDPRESSDFQWYPIERELDLPLAFSWIADAYRKLRH